MSVTTTELIQKFFRHHNIYHNPKWLKLRIKNISITQNYGFEKTDQIHSHTQNAIKHQTIETVDTAFSQIRFLQKVLSTI